LLGNIKTSRKTRSPAPLLVIKVVLGKRQTENRSVSNNLVNSA